MRTIRAMVIGSSLALVAALAPAGAAHAADGTVDIGNTGTLVAQGIGVSLPFTITCTSDLPPDYTFASANLTQRQGQSLVQGSAGQNGGLICDGTPRTIELFVTGASPFKKGLALASVYFEVCGSHGCFSDTVYEEVTIQR